MSGIYENPMDLQDDPRDADDRLPVPVGSENEDVDEE